MSDQSAGVVSTLEKIKSLCEKVRLKVLTTVHEAQKLTAHGLEASSMNTIWSAVPTAGSDPFKHEKEALQREVDKLKDQISS